MIQDWLEDIKNTPTRLKEVPKRARRRAHVARATSRGNLWNAGANALEAAESFFASAPDNVPVLSRVADAAERVTHERLEAFTRVSLEDYTTLNAKEAIRAVSSLEHLELLRVKRLEESTKARKTVLAAIEKAITRAVERVEEDVAA